MLNDSSELKLSVRRRVSKEQSRAAAPLLQALRQSEAVAAQSRSTRAQIRPCRELRGGEPNHAPLAIRNVLVRVQLHILRFRASMFVPSTCQLRFPVVHQLLA